jgi:hypothetical protein
MPKDFFVSPSDGACRAATKGIIGFEQDFNVSVLCADSFCKLGKESFADPIPCNVDSRNIVSVGRKLKLNVRVPEKG